MNTSSDRYWDTIVTAGTQVRGKAREVSAMILAAHAAGNSVYICGNGGSAAIASHFACDLAWGRCGLGRHQVRAISLNDQLSLLSALENDVPHGGALAWMVNCYGRPGDVLVAISSSGASENILAAVRAAHGAGMATVGMCGFDGGKLRDLAQTSIWVPAEDYGIVEDIHGIFCHTIARAVGEGLESARAAAATAART